MKKQTNPFKRDELSTTAGVHFSKYSKKYVVRVWHNNKLKSITQCDDQDKANKIYNDFLNGKYINLIKF